MIELKKTENDWGAYLYISPNDKGLGKRDKMQFFSPKNNCNSR